MVMGSNIKKHGYIYDWETAQNVCPVGWHLPSEGDWNQFIENLEGDSLVMPKLNNKSEWTW